MTHKQKNGKVKTIIAIVSITIIIIGCVMTIAKAYFILPVEVVHQAEHIEKIEGEVEGIDARVDLVEDVVSIIQNDLNYIRGDMAEQKELSKEILKELRK